MGGPCASSQSALTRESKTGVAPWLFSILRLGRKRKCAARELRGISQTAEKVRANGIRKGGVDAREGKGVGQSPRGGGRGLCRAGSLDYGSRAMAAVSSRRSGFTVAGRRPSPGMWSAESWCGSLKRNVQTSTTMLNYRDNVMQWCK